SNKILLIGSSGLVGSRFVELFPDKRNLLTPEFSELDITNLNQVQEYFHNHHPDIVINFAAYTNVSEAEKQRGDKAGSCWLVNVEGVKNILNSLDQNTRFIHISTDMVFSGSAADPGPYSADHKPETNSQNLTWYGYTKAEAERVIGSSGAI